MTAIVWLRRDLRLTDQPALAAALARHERIVPVYIHAPAEEAPWSPGAASRWWLHHSLAALARDIAARGGRLLVREGDSLATLRALVRETGATAVFWNRLYEPALVERDAAIKAALREDGVAAESHGAALLVEPWTVLTAAGEPYRVFTPFWRTASQRLDSLPPPVPAPPRLPAVAAALRSEPLDSLGLLPRIRWDTDLASRWMPGEAGALARLDAFVGDTLARYRSERDRPDRDGSSRLSPHLHFGELSPRQALAAVRGACSADPAAAGGAESFVRELGWREFAHYLLFHFPQTAAEPLDARFAALPWQQDEVAIAAWRRGRTGYPIVDAGLRELWHTGFMHNRVRMIAASLLTRNLFVNWLEGARWFWDTLLDADLANNTLGWQWTAGCGADAAPYFRIFSPVLQAERFDPGRAYLRRWCPELARLPDRWIHQPWAAPRDVLAAAGVLLGRDYPEPVVDPRASRALALERFAGLKTIEPGRTARRPGDRGL
ncbi:MAG: deoxyribodipyrimidine photo-lyase [Steroidobacteraceae bacterium]